MPGKAPKTQHDYRRYIGRLREVFGDCHLISVRRSDIAQYLDRRSAKIEGNPGDGLSVLGFPVRDPLGLVREPLPRGAA